MLNGNSDFSLLIQALVDHTSSVIYFKDVNYRYMLINRQFEELFHVSRAEIAGKTDFEIFPSELAEVFRTNDRQVLETGKRLQCEEIAKHDDGYHRYLSLKFPLCDSQGAIYAMAGISTDITDRIQAQNEIASLQYYQRLILDSVGDGICGLDRQGCIVFLNPAAEQMLHWKTEELRGQPHTRITMTRNSFSPTSNDGIERNTDPIQAVLNGQPLIRVQGARFRRQNGTVLPVELTVAPIHTGEQVLGAVIAFRDQTERLRHVEIEQEIQTARRIQLSLTPRHAPQVPGFDFAAMSIPCSKACGDYYDFIPWGDNRLGVVVGDVSGHGLGAALEMVETRAILRTTMLSETSPVQCMTLLNQILAEDLPDDMFVTLFLMELNLKERTFDYASAGHEAFLLRTDNQIERLDSTGPVLGWDPTVQYTNNAPTHLNSGDMLIITTDGIIETVSPARALFGRERLLEIAIQNRDRPARDILLAIRDATDEFRGMEPQRDDVTAIIVRIV